MEILDQLTEYCSCVKVDEQDVTELIHLISSVTGWSKDTCDTFLTGLRTEIIDLPDCMDCPYEFEPYYHPYDPESFSFKLVTIDEMSETYTDLEYGYIPSKGVFRVDTTLPKCHCTCRKCGCKTEYKLLVQYTAGYEEIPDCLLPVMCNLLDVIQKKNECDCGCGCETAEKAEDIEYATGDVVTVQIETDLGKMLVADYKRELGKMSLLKRHKFVGVVV